MIYLGKTVSGIGVCFVRRQDNRSQIVTANSGKAKWKSGGNQVIECAVSYKEPLRELKA